MCLSSCDTDPYKGERPIDYPGSKWICVNADIYFEVDNADKYIFNTSDESINFEFLFSQFGPEVAVQRVDNNETLFTGKCEFGESTFRIIINEENNYFKDLPITLIFNRI